MIKRKIASIFIILFISSSNLYLVSGTLDEKQPLEAKTITYTDFSGFTQKMDSSYITSNIDNSSLEMYANYDSYTGSEYEKYHLIFDSAITVTNFDLEIDFTYSYTGSMVSGIYVILGSYHNEQGATASENTLCTAVIWDPWEASSGVYLVRAYGDIDDSRTGSTISKEGDITFHFVRTDTKLTITIAKDGVVKHSGSWNTNNGLSRDFDFMNIHLNVNPYYIQNTYSFFSSINLVLTTSTNTNNNNGLSNPLSTNAIIGISVSSTILLAAIIGGVVFLSIRKKKATSPSSQSSTPQQNSLLSLDNSQNEELPELKFDSTSYSWQMDNEG
ncbi:MAG: hypothetical protein ACFFDW_08190 [Candidatus Thorarchaeota archaeon]